MPGRMTTASGGRGDKVEMTVVCAWCEREMKHGGAVVSHGICLSCGEKVLNSAGTGQLSH